MPLLDVSELTLDPDFATTFQVLRRAEANNQYGEPVLTPASMSAVGVVCQASPSDLQRLPGYDFGRRTLSICTKFRLQLASPGFKADVVVWRGDNYLVIDVQPYTEFGAGFVEALATSMDRLDQPPKP